MHEQSINFTGGASIGWVHASWPFAKLIINADSLLLQVKFIGTYEFDNKHVELKKHSLIPVLNWGLRIVHENPNYPKKIIFWCFTNPTHLLRKIQTAGFVDLTRTAISPNLKEFPVRWQALVILGLAWNFLLFADLDFQFKASSTPGIYTWLALFLLFAGTLLIRRWNMLQRAILKPGYQLSLIMHWVNLIAVIAGLACAMLSYRLFF